MNERFPRVGVIGAGQLARMMVAPASALGINLLLFAQSADDSAAQINNYVVGDYTDLEALKSFAARCDVITFEHELLLQEIWKKQYAVIDTAIETIDFRRNFPRTNNVNMAYIFHT